MSESPIPPVHHSQINKTSVSALPLSAPAITGLVLGGIALLMSAIPIVNNFAFFLALLGGIFSVVGLAATVRKKRRGKVLAIIALILCVVSVAVVLATQNMYGKAIDEAFSELGGSASSQQVTEGASEKPAASKDASKDKDYTNLEVGKSVTFKNGLTVQVDAVKPGLSKYDGTSVTGVSVTYSNNGTKEVSFNTFDWKGQDAQGTLRSSTYYDNAENDLNSGQLISGGTVSGNIYFEGDLSKVVYYSNMFNDSPDAGWVIQ